MKKLNFEKISSKKFENFEKASLLEPNFVFGGYKGETSRGHCSDQIKSGGVDETCQGGIRNDGFDFGSNSGN